MLKASMQFFRPLATLGLCLFLGCQGGSNVTAAPQATDTPQPTAAPVPIPYGFGSRTSGGAGKTVVHVTNTSDSGPGSLREALSGGDRTVVFDVSGTIQLGDYLWIRDAHITLDGTSAPGNGITLMGHPLIVYNGAHDIILRGFRHRSGWKLGNGTRNSEGGCLTIWKNCFNVLIDHVSVSGFEDEGMNVWEGCHDITIQNCIFGPGTYLNPSTGLLEHNFALLVGSGSSRVSIFRNLFAHTNYRNPAIGYDDAGGTVAPELTGDVVNNVIWEYTGFGTTVYWGGKANVIGNYYQTSAYPARTNRAVNTDANTVAAGASYAQGNFSRDGSSVSGTLSSPFPIPADALLPALDAIQAANLVKSEAGCRTGGLDPVDQELVNELKF